MEALGINIGYLLMQIAGITVLYFVLKGLTYEPILNVLEQRKERIAKGLEDARQAAIARDNAEAEANKIREDARAEAAKIRSDAVTAAEASAKNITVEANDEARNILAAAREDAEEERNRVLAGLRSQVAAISMAAANKIVGASLSEARQRELIGEFFAKVPASVSGVSGAKATVTSALPLTDEEVAQVKKAISASEVEFKVDPDILGGLVIRVGDQVIDNSVAAQMSEMAGNLK
ncbi:MAG: F0F1 ATP synthase subunit B [Ardenticatenaceae bacterium]|nr:F0F1 ATP synthase subunit B [Ardenticatenaceae bacterium]